MQELIPLQLQTIDGNTVETVSARELHSFLESRQDFSTWIKKRIEQYDFVENQDFLVVTEKKVTMTDAGEKATLIKEHRHVCRDIENLNLEYGKLSLPKVGETHP